MPVNIQKRDGTLQSLHLNKIVHRIHQLIQGDSDKGDRAYRIGIPLSLDASTIALEVCKFVTDKIKSTDLDDITAQICADKVLENPEYEVLAKRLVVSNNHKGNRAYVSFQKLIEMLNGDTTTTRFSHSYLELIRKYGERLDQVLDFSRDYDINYFGYRTLEQNYLLKTNHNGITIYERPQHLWMRVALEIHRSNLPAVIQAYHRLSQFYYIHATPTLYNSGLVHNQLASCFLSGAPDSIHGMYEYLRRLAIISKHSGGVGSYNANIRGANSLINDNGGRGSGIVPIMRVRNETAKHVDQGGKRKGSFAEYLEPWCSDIMEFLVLKKDNGNEDFRARDIFPALFVNDIFMSRVKQAIVAGRDEKNPVMWSLMSSDTSPGLIDLWGAEFDQLYLAYEAKGQYVRQVDVLTVWDAIIEAQIEKGVPYMVYKDAANRMCNQQNIGTVKCSNLCVSGDTRLLIRRSDSEYGSSLSPTRRSFKSDDFQQVMIRELCGKLVDIWNGFEWSETTIYQTGNSQQLLDIELSNGVRLSTTRTHKFILSTGERIDASQLQIGSCLSDYQLPDLSSNDSSGRIHSICCHLTKHDWSDYCQESLLNLRLELQKYGVDSQVVPMTGEGATKYRIELFDHLPEKVDLCCPNIARIITQAAVVPKPPLQVMKISQCSVPQRTYCFKELKRESGLFNGVLTGNCAEIIEVSSFDEIASCNLASLCLSKFVKQRSNSRIDAWKEGEIDLAYDFDNLVEVSGELCQNLNNVIDRGYYPLSQIQRSNFRHRPIGIGVQGLADVFFQLRTAYESEAAADLNRLIAEAIYYGAVKSTIQLAKQRAEQMSHMIEWSLEERLNLVKLIGTYDLTHHQLDNFKQKENLLECEQHYLTRLETQLNNWYSEIMAQLAKAQIDPDHFNWLELQYWKPSDPPTKWGAYSTFEGSPASRGQFRFDLSNHQPSGRFDWETLRQETEIWGWRNSLMVAYMPTATVAQITGNVECFEQPTSNIYSRSVLSGQFMIVNKYMQDDLIQAGLWNRETVEQIIGNRGSVQNLSKVTKDFKDLYKTSWELSKKTYINMARSRQDFIDQSQSMNLFITDPTASNLSSALLYGWEQGLITGLYYLRRRTIANAQQFTLEAHRIGANITHPSHLAEQTANDSSGQKSLQGLVCPLNPENFDNCQACQ